jgi:hypothetical protein
MSSTVSIVTSRKRRYRTCGGPETIDSWGLPFGEKLLGVALEVSFVRHRDRRDRVYVKRSDSTSTSWDFPSYGDRLPHDLCHVVVEEVLGITQGFWGLVDQGVDVRLIDNQAVLVRDGKPIVQQVGVDFSDLLRAEEAVALLSPTGLRTEQVGAVAVVHLDSTSIAKRSATGFESQIGFHLPAGTSEQTISSIRQRLHKLGEQWRALSDGGSITLNYAGSSSSDP